MTRLPWSTSWTTPHDDGQTWQPASLRRAARKRTQHRCAPRRAAHRAQAGKGLAGLDEHQVRRWISWQRCALLAMIAHALLAVIAACEHDQRPAPTGLIALTCNEIRRLFTIFVIEPGRTTACPEAWSRWRRVHQHRARTSHYQHQEAARLWA